MTGKMPTNMSTLNQQRLIIFLIGFATIAAGAFTWRGGQLASSAAFDDRQSVGQTITQQQQRIEVGLSVVNDARAYVAYVADYTEAAALDDQAVEIGESIGSDSVSGSLEEQADSLRSAASAQAAAAGVFGLSSVYADREAPTVDPRAFDFDTQVTQAEVETTTGLTSPGRLDPDYWAQEADELRNRVRGLRVAAFVIIVSVVFFTIAQMTDRLRTRIATGATGSAVFGVTSVLALVTVW